MPTSIMNWAIGSSTWATSSIAGVFGAGLMGVDGLSPSPLTGNTTIVPAPILAGAAGTATLSQTVPSAFIGTLIDIGCASVATATLRGDSVTIGSDTWYMCTHNGGSTILFRAV